MEFKDYYKILGVEKTATADEIRTAYRRLARKYHPDVSKEPDAETRMQEINEARDVLGDPEKRSAYDQLGSHPHGERGFQPPPGWDAGAGSSRGGSQGGGFHGGSFQGNADYSEFFSDLFGAGGRHQAHGFEQTHGFHAQGADRHARIEIDLADSYEGATRSITLQQPVVDAQGRISRQERTLNVKIPKGIREGQHIRLRGQGEPGLGEGPAGDLYLDVSFRADPRYRVDGQDVHVTLPVTPWEAGLGATIKARSPAGTFNVKVPPESQNGHKLRLSGRGLPGEPAGNLYFVLEVVLPPAGTDKARQVYETMAREMPFNPREHQGA